MSIKNSFSFRLCNLIFSFLQASSDIDLKSTLEQVEKQRKQIAKYETERVQFKTRIKELSEELVVLQSANREAHGSDEDSPDQMSEIERQQELLSKMSAKSKHIARLLKDIDVSERLFFIWKNIKINLFTALL